MFFRLYKKVYRYLKLINLIKLKSQIRPIEGKAYVDIFYLFLEYNFFLSQHVFILRSF